MIANSSLTADTYISPVLQRSVLRPGQGLSGDGGCKTGCRVHCWQILRNGWDSAVKYV